MRYSFLQNIPLPDDFGAIFVVSKKRTFAVDLVN